jgi:hypothetical protein
VKQKPSAGSPFFETFPSDPIPKTTKGVNVHLFIHNFTVRDEITKGNGQEVKNSGKIRKRIPRAL